MSDRRNLLAPLSDWWAGLTARERLLVGVLPFIALAGAAYTLNLETTARIEALVEQKQELQALGQAPAGAWLSARELALGEREAVLAEAFTAINDASAREYVRGILDSVAVESGIPALTIQVRTPLATISDGEGVSAPPGSIQFLEVDIAGPFKWDTFLTFQTKLAAYREIAAWPALSFDEAGDSRFRATLKVAYVLRSETP